MQHRIIYLSTTFVTGLLVVTRELGKRGLLSQWWRAPARLRAALHTTDVSIDWFDRLYQRYYVCACSSSLHNVSSLFFLCLSIDGGFLVHLVQVVAATSEVLITMLPAWAETTMATRILRVTFARTTSTTTRDIATPNVARSPVLTWESAWKSMPWSQPA